MRRLFILVFSLVMVFPPSPIRAQTESPDARVIPLDLPLRLHSLPALQTDVTALVESGAALTIRERTADGEWLHVRSVNGDEGWLMAEFAELFIDLSLVPVMTEVDDLPHEIIEFAPVVVKRIRRIFLDGQALGNRARMFSKAGDSITAAPHLLNPIGEGLYNLGDFQYLQGVIDVFTTLEAREGKTAFNNPSLAADIGWPAHAAIDPKFADPLLCREGETPLVCEYRVARPAIALIMFGTNDVARFSASIYEGNLQQIVHTSIQMGVIPVISTIPNRVGYEEAVAEYNQVIAETARQFSIPLWDYYSTMESLPNGGLEPDGIHPTIPPRGYKGAADFRTSNLYYGYVVRNLTALQMLDAVWGVIKTEGEPEVET